MTDEDFTTSPNHPLTFSIDSLDFDTLISGDLSHTQTFQVYNKNDKALRIKQISLLNGKNSIFRVNVDGTSLSEDLVGDFELRAGDSLRIFVNALPPLTDQDFPILHTDKLLFQLESGKYHELPLKIYGWDVIKLKGLNINDDTSFNATRPYNILDSLVVLPKAELTIHPGTQLLFHANSKLIVYGRLKVLGAIDANVVFRGDRLGNMFTNQSYDCIPGQWGGIEIKSQSYGNLFDYADIHSGNFGIVCDSSDVTIEKVRIENCIIHNTTYDALSLNNVSAVIGNSQITNSGGNCISIKGGDVQIIHSTIGQFYAFEATRGVALHFSSNAHYPLHRLEVFNSIVTGYSSDEIMGVKETEESSFNYKFQNCLLNTPPYESPEIINCFWDNSDYPVSRADNFYPEFDLDKLIFNFYLSPQSQAVGNADASITASTYPNDRVGVIRSERPSIGCYEYVAPLGE